MVHYSIPSAQFLICNQKIRSKLSILNDFVAEFHSCRIIMQEKPEKSASDG
jgi:hypothetical protein